MCFSEDVVQNLFGILELHVLIAALSGCYVRALIHSGEQLRVLAGSRTKRELVSQDNRTLGSRSLPTDWAMYIAGQ